nr:immunoglobulin heavy chain junction region [Mus musculus]
ITVQEGITTVPTLT